MAGHGSDMHTWGFALAVVAMLTSMHVVLLLVLHRRTAKPVLAALSSRPHLLVIVVGETARAANWGLNGYSRQTTPELSKLDVLNFSDVNVCALARQPIGLQGCV